MKTLDNTELLFPQNSAGKFLLYSCNSKVGEIALPAAGVTFFPPEQKFEEGAMSQILRIRFDFLDGDGMALLRRVVRFHNDDPWRHKLRLVLPGESARGYEAVPHGNWRAWFFDDEPRGYGPVEAQFISTEKPDVAPEQMSDAQPWVIE